MPGASTGYMGKLEEQEELITEFDEELLIGTIEELVVNVESGICFLFKNDLEIEINI